MLPTTADVDLVEALGSDGHGFAIQQSGDSALTGFQAFILAVGTGGWIVRFIIQRLLVGGDEAFKIAQDHLVI